MVSWGGNVGHDGGISNRTKREEKDDPDVFLEGPGRFAACRGEAARLTSVFGRTKRNEAVFFLFGFGLDRFRKKKTKQNFRWTLLLSAFRFTICTVSYRKYNSEFLWLGTGETFPTTDGMNLPSPDGGEKGMRSYFAIAWAFVAFFLLGFYSKWVDKS